MYTELKNKINKIVGELLDTLIKNIFAKSELLKYNSDELYNIIYDKIEEINDSIEEIMKKHNGNEYNNRALRLQYCMRHDLPLSMGDEIYKWNVIRSCFKSDIVSEIEYISEDIHKEIYEYIMDNSNITETSITCIILGYVCTIHKYLGCDNDE